MAMKTRNVMDTKPTMIHTQLLETIKASANAVLEKSKEAKIGLK